MAWTPPKDAVVAQYAAPAWTPPPDAIAAEPAQSESTGKRLGRAVTQAPAKLAQAAKDVGEIGAAVGTGAVAPITGAAVGAAKKLDQLTGSSNPVANFLFPGFMAKYNKTASPSEARELAMEETTYAPRSGAAQQALGALANAPVIKQIGQAGRFVGDVAEGATGSKYIGDVVSDAATGVVGYGVAKAAPKVIARTVDASKAVGRTAVAAGKAAKTGAVELGKIYTPEMQQTVALGHLAAGDVAGAAIQGGFGTARKAFANRKKPASVAEVVAEPTIPGVTTQAEAAAIRDIVAQRRAEVAARNKASGRNVQSTM